MEFIDLPDRIAPHNPKRYRTVTGLDDIQYTNGARAALAEKFLKTRKKPTDDEEEISDLMVDLLHFAHSRKQNPLNILRRTARHFLNEAGPLPKPAKTSQKPKNPKKP